VLSHARRTSLGMANFLSRAEEDGHLCMRDLNELREYCYTVAGIVGELLTTLFLKDAPELARERPVLRAHAAAFGEALQLVNVLKDEREDASAGRRFLPPSLSRESVIALARRDLARARLYGDALVRGNAPGGMIAFTALPVELAEATLVRIEQDGPGAKVSRADVLAMLQRHELTAHSEPATPREPIAESSVGSCRNLSGTSD
ncbi:MAG: squalene/phytoene synthase family protein, partial [Gemmatimonadaceae bacterium]